MYCIRNINIAIDYHGAGIMLLYNGKGNKCDCSNSRGISLLSVIGKLYDRVHIKSFSAGTACAIGEGQCRFRQGRGCFTHGSSVLPQGRCVKSL